jgi:hypothetical protein
MGCKISDPEVYVMVPTTFRLPQHSNAAAESETRSEKDE